MPQTIQDGRAPRGYVKARREAQQTHERDIRAARTLAKRAPRRKPRQPGSGPHILDPAAL